MITKILMRPLKIPIGNYIPEHKQGTRGVFRAAGTVRVRQAEGGPGRDPGSRRGRSAAGEQSAATSARACGLCTSASLASRATPSSTWSRRVQKPAKNAQIKLEDCKFRPSRPMVKFANHQRCSILNYMECCEIFV